MGVFTRGNTLWLRWRTGEVDKHGRPKWRSASSMLCVGNEVLAAKMLADVEAAVAVKRPAPSGSGSPLLRDHAMAWLDTLETETVKDDRSRVVNHILPVLGDVRLDELRPKLIRDLVESLKTKATIGNRHRDGSRPATGELLSPRTIRHVYTVLHRMLEAAVADELIASNPCVLKPGELPREVDKDRTWRRTAVFTRDEVETIVSAADKIPEDRRVLDALFFIGGMRFGEAAALTWRDYDADATPLGKLVIEKSYSTRAHKVKSTKTDNPREMPVHPMLAKILATWKLGGFKRFTGRDPKPDDPIVPSTRGTWRNVNVALRHFHKDLESLELRTRRQHDGRRTFISIARADGARPDILRWATHGPSGDVIDDYTTLPWSTLCDEVAKVKLAVREGLVIEMPIARAVGDGSAVTTLVTVEKSSVVTTASKKVDGWGSPGRDRLKGTPALLAPAVQVVRNDHQEVTGPSTPSQDPVAEKLADAARTWSVDGDAKALRRALLAVLAELD